jgi:membrane fusion protein, heavy metal efflux system
MRTPTDFVRTASLLTALVLVAPGCRSKEEQAHAPAAEDASWSVTSWGEKYELFPETKPLVAGASAPSHTHVTILSDFAPLREGNVEAILRGSGGEQTFAGVFKRDGIFDIDIKPAREGTYDLSFRINSKAGVEEVPGGRVKVGTAKEPGGLTDAPPPPFGTTSAEAADQISFLKEQQWKTEFATAWVREGRVPTVVRGPAKVKPAAGGEAILTAPVDAVLARAPWPHPGQLVSRGRAVFRLLPSLDGSRSLPELTSNVADLEAETGAARGRVQRLEDLLKVEAVSKAEVERARAAAAGLEARLSAARSDLGAARAARTGGSTRETLPVSAPWNGVVASIDVSPGQAIAAGTALGRLVKPSPLWLEIALRPQDAARITTGVQGVSMRRSGDAEPVVLEADQVRLVSRSAEIDASTGTRAVLLEVQVQAEVFPIGSVVEAEARVSGDRPGIVIPASALVDDGGTTVVYIQLSGEGFERREVRVTGRSGTDVAVEGLRPGERLVTKGGAAIRRATLLSTGAPEGHVH